MSPAELRGSFFSGYKQPPPRPHPAASSELKAAPNHNANRPDFPPRPPARCSLRFREKLLVDILADAGNHRFRRWLVARITFISDIIAIDFYDHLAPDIGRKSPRCQSLDGVRFIDDFDLMISVGF